MGDDFLRPNVGTSVEQELDMANTDKNLHRFAVLTAAGAADPCDFVLTKPLH